ncbi:hypothetical protein LTR70_004210 [Exophiala xenobiotica]|uniref:Uncharacterized protein n=1 Tax=Lithohypha guttulata TaxID=1690604 RepID=A0ABR0KEA4_9EURO|nr:hypothetical protein LTR24_003692 [Lithohypha guttulata]KAK5321497.1 hypothetical protein LTR70_004210 [Exophiala xenobiotica]
MASKQIEAISSFEHVVDNVPEWKRQLSELVTYTTGRHEEYVAEYSRLVQQATMRRKKSASIASIHSDEEEQQHTDEAEEPCRSPQPSELVEIDPLEAGNRFIYAQANRKRKPGTSIRSIASDPRAYRSKQMVVIYYDSHIQTELERLVKSLGVARNTLRKGKNAYTAAKGFALPSLSRRYQNLDNLVPNTITKSHPRLAKASSETSAPTLINLGNGDAAFTSTDKELEQVQALCETAAHQAIRDGDCKVALREACGKLDVLLTMAHSTIDMLKAEKQKRTEEEAQPGDDTGGSDGTSTQTTLCEKPSIEALGVAHKVLPPWIESLEALKRPPLPDTISAPDALLSADTIEVDDDEDSSVDIDLNISTYRSTCRRLVA